MKKLSKSNFFLIALYLHLFVSPIKAQQYLWADKIVSSTSHDNGRSMVTDASENVYTTGSFGGTSDFDPGAGTSSYSSNGGMDIYIVKLNASGSLLWAKTIGGIQDDEGSSLVADAAGNVYVTGFFKGTVDFDPGTGITNLTANYQDAFILKLDASGNFVWANRIGTSGQLTSGYSIDLDAVGNVYYSGIFSGMVDFDSGAGVSNLTGTNSIYISKISNVGSFIWAKCLAGGSYSQRNSIAVDVSGNVYSAGDFLGNVDFDPGVATYTLSASSNSNPFISKLDASGNFVWAKQMISNGNSLNNAIAIDNSGNIYTIGALVGTTDFDPGSGTYTLTSAGSVDISVCKYTSAGIFSWAYKLGDTGSEVGRAITTDAAGNVYFTGQYTSIIDFNPGVGTFNLSAGGGFVCKLDVSGGFVWAKNLGGNSTVWGIDIGTSNAVYTMGVFMGTGDFDTGTGSYNLSANSLDNDVFVHKMCNSDIQLSASNPCLGQSFTLFVNTISGATYSWQGPNGFSYSGQNPPAISNASALNNGAYTVTVNNGCLSSDQVAITVKPLPVVTPSVTTPVCAGQILILSVNNTPGTGVLYNWIGPNSYASPVTIPNILNVTTAASGVYTITVTSSNGCQNSNTISATVNPKPNVNASATTNSVCAGDLVTLTAGGANTYTWTGGITNGVSFAPIVTRTYTVTGTDLSTSCTNTATQTVTVKPTPSGTISSVNNSKCSGSCNGSSILNVSGGTPPMTYIWTGGQTTSTVSALCEGTHVALVRDVNGCSTSNTVIIITNTVADPNIYLTNLAALDQANVSPSFAAYYTYNLPSIITPPPSNPRNFVDPGKKARFKVECINNKSNGLSIVSGICKVRTNNPNITITDSSSALNNIGWGNYAWSADEFEIDIDANTPQGTNVYIDFVVQESNQDFKTTCIAIPIIPLVYAPPTLATIDDDNNPDSHGNNNDICNPGETIEFYPLLDNTSKLNAEYVRGRFENLDNHSFINIWNGVPGVNTTVYDATWWNYYTAQPQMVNFGSMNTAPEYDFVFDYTNSNTINNFKLYLVMAGGFKLFTTNALSLVQWTLPYTFNNTTTISVNELEVKDIITTPNPSSGIFKIKSDINLNNMSIKVFNSQGQLVLESIQFISEIDLSNQVKGIYFLQLKSDNKLVNEKIIIQ